MCLCCMQHGTCAHSGVLETWEKDNSSQSIIFYFHVFCLLLLVLCSSACFSGNWHTKEPLKYKRRCCCGEKVVASIRGSKEVAAAMHCERSERTRGGRKNSLELLWRFPACCNSITNNNCNNNNNNMAIAHTYYYCCWICCFFSLLSAVAAWLFLLLWLCLRSRCAIFASCAQNMRSI